MPFQEINFLPTGKFAFAAQENVFDSRVFDSRAEAKAAGKADYGDIEIKTAEIAIAGLGEFFRANVAFQNALEAAADHVTEAEINRVDSLINQNELNPLQSKINEWIGLSDLDIETFNAGGINLRKYINVE